MGRGEICFSNISHSYQQSIVDKQQQQQQQSSNIITLKPSLSFAHWPIEMSAHQA
jgi:hypothetical protein